MQPKLWILSSLAALSLVFAACGDDPAPPKDKDSKAVEIVSLSVDPASVEAGDTVKVSWETRYAESIALTANGTSIEVGGADLGQGSVEVVVESTTTFQLVATGKAPGDIASRTAEVRVGAETLAPEIVSFFSDPASIEGPGEVELRWTTRNVETLRLLDGSGSPVDISEQPAEEGAVLVTVETTTAFTLIAEREGEKIERELTVEVTVAAPRIVAFEANPAEVDEGTRTTLSWTTLNAKTVRIEDDTGAPIDLRGQPAVEGSVEVLMQRSRTFTLFAESDDLSAERTVHVKVTGTPIVTLTATPETFSFGESTTLRWITDDAVSVRITDSHGETIVDTTEELTGQRILRPEANTTYTLTAMGTIRAATATVSVEVSPTIMVFEAVDPSGGGVGDLKELRWVVGGAQAVEISNGDGIVETKTGAAAAQGTVVLPMGAAGRFVLTATSGSHVVESEFFLPIVNAPGIGTFSAAAEIVSKEAGGTATASLSWSGVNRATTLELDSDTLGLIDLGSRSKVADSIDVSITADTIFTLTARNDDGESSRSVTVRAVDLPVIDSLDVSLSYAGVGEVIDVSWATTGATQIVLKQNGLVVPGIRAAAGTIPLEVSVATTFTLEALNDAGDVATSTVDVAVGPPFVSSFTASPVHAWLGESVTFAWEAGGASLLKVSAPTSIVCTTSVRSEIEEGSCTSGPLSEAGTFVYTLEVRNTVGQIATETVSVQVGSGPSILNFTVAPSGLLSGQSISVNWTVTPDPDGAAPTLAFEADVGGPYVLPAGNSGTASFTLTDAGVYNFTLTATTASAGSTPAVKTRSVTVYAEPTVTLAADPLVFDDEIHTGVDLAWTSSAADLSLQLFELDAAGQPMLIHDVPSADRASGFWTVNGSSTTVVTYRVVATNALGMTATEEIEVHPASTEILTFTATPPVYPVPGDPDVVEVLAGDEVLLEWTTKRATAVELDLLKGMVMGPSQNPYLDNPVGATHLVMDNCGTSFQPGDEGCAVMDFPAGFVFPYDGQDHTQLKVYLNGLASFDLARRLSSYTKADLAANTSSTYAYAHFAVFWRDLFTPTALSTGNVFYWDDVDANGDRYVVVQWKNAAFASGGTDDLNFQIVFWESGVFEYRYGLMYGSSVSNQESANGKDAAIGYQFPNLGGGKNLSYNTQVPGGLSNRSFSFTLPPSLGLNDSYVWTPVSGTAVTTRAATLKATGMGTDTKTVSVSVHPRATVTLSGPEFGTRNVPFTINWTSSNATLVEILDEVGTVVCTSGSTSVASGSCDLVEPASGPVIYTAVSTGALGHTVTATIEVVVTSADFAITSFEASDDLVNYAQPVTLSWETGDADELTITANGQPVALPPTIDFDSGSFTVPSLTEETEFVLSILNTASGGERTAAVTVGVRTFTLSFDADVTDLHPGDPVTLTWAATSLTGGTVEISMPGKPMTEDLSGSNAFIDISGEPGVETLVGTNIDGLMVTHDFTDGFTFPYQGTDLTQVRVSADGWLSFDVSAATSTSNQRMPASGSSYNKVHLAPFWNDLHTRTPGRVYAAAVGSDYVISWDHISPFSGSSSTSAFDLNFQVVLHADGSFDYRYGAMTPPPSTSTSCYPSTCVNEANGASATVGYQGPGGLDGYTLFFGGTSNSASNPTFPGGLANRTFTYDPNLTGSLTLNPFETGDYEICASLGGYTECRTVTVRADFEISEFTLSESAIDWGQSVELSWVTKGGDLLSLKENGVEIVNQDTVNITGHTLLLTPDRTATYELEIENTYLGRKLTATKNVSVAQFDMSLSASDSSVVPGSEVVLSWDSGAFNPNAQVVLLSPMEEVTDTSAFVDVRTIAGFETITGAGDDDGLKVHPLPAGFTFPFIGEVKTSLLVSTNGFISFDTGTISTSWTNQRLPVTTSDYKKVHLAPFWDDLHTRSSGGVHAAAIDDTYVIQWSQVSAAGGSNTNEYDLNFQVVLHPDGAFEYRYGSMTPPPSTSTSCYPNTCVNETLGSSATVGYQEPTGTFGYQLHYGGASGSASNPVFTGGLANRAWMFTPTSGLSGTITVKPSDTTIYTVCVQLGATRNCSSVTVEANWAIESFAASPPSFVLGEDVVLSWLTSGGDSFAIKKTEGTVVTDLTVAGLDVDGDSYSDTPTGPTTYTFELYSLGRTKTSSIFVDVRTVGVELIGTTDSILAGESVTFNWDVTAFDTGTPEVWGPLLEMDASPGGGGTFADTDISGLPGVATVHAGGLDSTVSNHAFQDGFTFPFGGTTYSNVHVSVDGYLSFVTSTSGSGSNQMIPNTSTTYNKMNLAVFWDDLHTRSSGRVYALALDPDTYVIQWSHISPYYGSSNTNEFDLNFQVVLHSDGAFEYRYGTMTPPPVPTTSASDCGLPSCEGEARGSSATIGYQNVAGTMGHQLHFGGTARSPSNPSFPGGLSNRSFRYDPNLPQTFTFSPRGTHTVTMCASLGAYRECKTTTIFVPGEGDVIISEVMINPDGGPGEQWFEVRNLLPNEIDLEGWTISTDAASHVIVGSLVIPPSGYAVLGGPASAGVADYLYDPQVTMASAGDTLSLYASAALVSSLTWDANWVIPVDASLELDATRQRRGYGVFVKASEFCEAESLYDGVNAGSPGADPSCTMMPYRYFPQSSMPAIDISSIGQSISTINGSITKGTAPLNFSFPFYDGVYTTVYPTSSGIVAMASTTNSGITNYEIPYLSDPASVGIVAPYWGYLVPIGTADFKWAQPMVAGSQVAVFQWNHWKHTTDAGDVTFQAQLWENGDIVFVYLDMQGLSGTGGSFTIGIQERGTTSPQFIQHGFKEQSVVQGQSIYFQRK